MTYQELAKQLEHAGAEIRTAPEEMLSGQALAKSADQLKASLRKFGLTLNAAVQSGSPGALKLAQVLREPQVAAVLVPAKLQGISKILLPKPLPKRAKEKPAQTLSRFEAAMVENGVAEEAVAHIQALVASQEIQPPAKDMDDKALSKLMLQLGELPEAIRSLRLGDLPLETLRTMCKGLGIKYTAKTPRKTLEKKLSESAERFSVQLNWRPIRK